MRFPFSPSFPPTTYGWCGYDGLEFFIIHSFFPFIRLSLRRGRSSSRSWSLFSGSSLLLPVQTSRDRTCRDHSLGVKTLGPDVGGSSRFQHRSRALRWIRYTFVICISLTFLVFSELHAHHFRPNVPLETFRADSIWCKCQTALERHLLLMTQCCVFTIGKRAQFQGQSGSQSQYMVRTLIPYLSSPLLP